MNAPIDPSISSLLRGSSLAPMMDQPVSHILHGMGLPQLPQLPPNLALRSGSRGRERASSLPR